MADNIIGAIREEELGNLSMEVLDYAERIALLFERIDEKFNSVSEVYDSESYFHLITSFARKIIFSVTSSKLISDVSTVTASSAGLRGATALWESL